MRAGIDNVGGAGSVDVVSVRAGSRDEVAEGVGSRDEMGAEAGDVDEVEAGVDVVKAIFVVVQLDIKRKS